MATCVYCKQPAGFLRWKHRDCKELHADGINKLSSLAGEELKTGAALPALPAQIREVSTRMFVSEAEARSILIRVWSEAVERSADQNGVDRDTEKRLVQFKDAFGLSQQELDRSHAYTRLVKALVLRDLSDGKMPERVRLDGSLQINLQKGEQIVWVFQPTGLLEDKTFREYVGRSSGVSVRVMRGVYYRTGAFRGHPIEHTQRIVTDIGFSAFTNKAIYFVGQKKSSRWTYKKIISFTTFSDGIGLVKDGANSKLQILRTGDGWFSYNLALGLAHFESDVSP